jgi:hypothetical protein
MVDKKKSRKLFGTEVPSELDPIVVVLENTDDDNVKFDNDDIKEEVLVKLGDHAAEITKNAGNNPSIRAGSTKINTKTAAGNPGAISGDNSAESVFTDTFVSQESERALAEFEQSSNSKLLPITIRKGKTDDQSLPTGLELLEEVNSSLAGSTLATAVREVTLANNRYACEDEFIPALDEAIPEDDTNVGHVILQQELGKHAPRNFPEVAGDGSDTQFKVKNLKNLGLQVLMEASGEYFVPDDTDDFASVIAAKAASSAPGLARLGIRIPVSRFSAATIAEEVNPDFQKNTRFPDLSSPQHFSYGNVNNPLVPFNAVSSTSAGIAAVLLAITVSTLVKALADLLAPSESLLPVTLPDPRDLGSSFYDSDRSTTPKEDYRKKRLGSYLGKDRTPQRESSTLPVPGVLGLFTGNFFILQPTQEPYGKAVSRGSEIFFGQATQGALGFVGAAFGIGDTFKHVSENPAYYNVLLRMLVRSTTESVGDIVNSVVGVAASVAGETNPIGNSALGAGAMDIDREIGIENDPTNLLNVVNSLRESKLLKFMDVLATIGDISLMTENTDGFDTTDLFESSIDGVRDFIDKDSFPNPAALVKKNRLSSNTGGMFFDNLAWGSNTLRSLYLLPTSIGSAEELFKGRNKVSNQLAGNPNYAAGSLAVLRRSQNRLNSEDVVAIEQELDSCYVPFYFHDLRTNEIISFHAFIENIDDSFDAEYTDSEGYGRIGKVHTYKNTNRSIGCSFRVVATNPSDFSEMWLKINKLVMLLYPQYTAGRTVSYGEGENRAQFIQPFSQLIGNSPMIRFRLGDLIKSNFSDFDLARMFGLGTEQFQLGSGATTEEKADTAQSEKIAEAVKTLISKHRSGNFEEGDTFFVLQPEDVGSRKSQTRAMFSKDGGNKAVASPSYSKYEVIKVYPLQRYGVRIVDAKDRFDDDFSVEKLFDYKRSGVAIEPDLDFITEKAETQVGKVPIDETTVNEVQDFFDPAKNPVVKSFDSVRGQGLAGFIKTLSFDWSDARWETEGLNNRAPMWCKIDINFAPVNDINPGLDSSGAPIGMPYNIGSLLKLMKINRGPDSNTDDKAAAYAKAKLLASTPSNGAQEDQANLTDPVAALKG